VLGDSLFESRRESRGEARTFVEVVAPAPFLRSPASREFVRRACRGPDRSHEKRRSWPTAQKRLDEPSFFRYFMFMF
jgi:hypothetical protein